MFVFRQLILLLLVQACCISPLAAEGLSEAAAIIKGSNAIYSGDDSLSTVSFMFKGADGIESRTEFTMLWKDYRGSGDFTEKVIFFKEFPTDGKGIGYMGWLRKPELNKHDDEWIYMPRLRVVRKMPPRENRAPLRQDEGFGRSQLLREHLTLSSRPLAWDEHRLLESEEEGGAATFYIVESTPHSRDANFPYGRTVSWIAKDSLLRTRTDYYDLSDQLRMRQTITWKEVDGAWLWDRVEGENLTTGSKTTIEVSDISLNVGLKDRVFSKRTLMTGGKRYRR